MIPKEPIVSIAEIEPGQEALVGHVLRVCRLVAEQAGLKDGYRVVTNIGSHAGQTVPHLHFHVMGGRSMSWPPG